MATPRRILVIEDDPDIAHLVQLHLRDAGYEADVIHDGADGLQKALGPRPYDLIVLDLTLPGVDGLEICRRVRAEAGDTLLLVLTARSSEIDRVLGLEMGADDYLVKPVGIRELLARVRALFRRAEHGAVASASPNAPTATIPCGSERAGEDGERFIQMGDLRIEQSKRRVTANGARVNLTAKEFDLLVQFACHPGRVYTRSDLLDLVWGEGYEGYEHTVNSHINRLRAKIETNPAKPHYLLTVWGVGYKFADDLNDDDDDERGKSPLRDSGPPSLPASVSAPAGQLPASLTRFFGREKEIASVSALLSAPETRLVTLTGMGGAGKTRLALEIAKRLRGTFGDALCFVPLADVTNAQRIPDAIRDALGRGRSASGAPPPPLTALVEALRERPFLLILDNCEHLADAATAFLRDLLAEVSPLICLVTSRQRLGIAGEREFPVLPLPTPGDAHDEPAAPEQLAGFASVALFADRARAARPDFAVTTGNAADVAALCRRLEGIPLALELAAARSGALSPAQMLSQLERRFDFLVSRERDVAPRHRSLRAALDWSCALLPADLARFFAHLSLFRGGWTHEAAALVGAVTPARALEYLELLQDGSLVLAREQRDGAMRFRMLETVRERAAELFREESADRRAASGRRHAGYFLHLAEQAEPQLLGAQQADWLDRLEAEHDNLRAALTFCQSNGDGRAAQAGLRLAGALWRFWYIHGHVAEGRERLAAVLARTETSSAGNGDDPQEDDSQEQERADARARALNGAGNLADHQGDYDAARAFYEECLELRRGYGDREGVAIALNNLGQVAHDQGDYARAHAFFEESLALWWEMRGRWGIAHLLDNKGRVARCQGDDATADSLFAVSLAMRRELGDKWGIGASLINLGVAAGDAGNVARARAFLEEGIAVWRELGDRRGIARCLEALAELWGAQGQPERMARLLGAAQTLRETVCSPRSLPERTRHERSIAAARAAVGEPAFTQNWAAGRAMPLEEAVACALLRDTATTATGGP